jgi:hypothetical protein
MMGQEPMDVVEMMEQEHREILALFESYAALAASQAGADERRALADEICMAITIHMRLENEMLYPVAVESVAGALLHDAENEHATTREQIASVLGTRPERKGYDEQVLALGRSVRHHVCEERQYLFPAVRVSGVDLARLGARLSERRLELQTVSDALREQAMLPAYA